MGTIAAVLFLAGMFVPVVAVVFGLALVAWPRRKPLVEAVATPQAA